MGILVHILLWKTDKIVERSNWRTWESVKDSGGLCGEGHRNQRAEQSYEGTYRE